MKRKAFKLHVATLLAFGALATWGCSDVGDNTTLPPVDNGSSDSSIDSTASGDDALGTNETSNSSSSSGSSSGGDDSSGGSNGEASADGAGSSSGEMQDAEGADASDTGVADTGVPDTGIADTGIVDSGIDSTIVDSGMDANEASSSEAGGAEAGHDAGPDATVDGGGGQEAGPGDSGGADAPTESGGGGGGLAPCTTSGQSNCVKCYGNNKAPIADGTCTPTEALIVQYDIDKGLAAAAGNAPAGSCYDCLYQNTCLDDTHYADTGHECGDSTITTGTAAQCLAVISCVLSTSCSSQDAVACYCGTAPEGTTCQGNPSSAINGQCDAPIAAGLGFTTKDGTDVTAHFTDGDKASGVADQLFNCAVNSQCTMCQQ